MTPSERYRELADAMRVKAAREDDWVVRSEWEHLARCYILLAEQADRNSRTDITYEPIL